MKAFIFMFCRFRRLTDLTCTLLPKEPSRNSNQEHHHHSGLIAQVAENIHCSVVTILSSLGSISIGVRFYCTWSVEVVVPVGIVGRK